MYKDVLNKIRERLHMEEVQRLERDKSKVIFFGAERRIYLSTSNFSSPSSPD
jgi:hypothetical protein